MLFLLCQKGCTVALLNVPRCVRSLWLYHYISYVVVCITVPDYHTICYIAELGHNSADYVHTVTEVLKRSTADCQWYCADSSVVPVPTKELLSKMYSTKQVKHIDIKR